MPQRFLRPGIRNSSHWNTVSFKAQTLWVRLLTLVDDFGRYDGRASVICGECFSVWNELHPLDVVNPQETAALCCELQANRLAEFYESDDKKVLQLLQWQERSRSEKSKWPDKNTYPQESAGIRSGILPPSPSPSPLVSTSSPLHVGVGVEESFKKLKVALCDLFKRNQTERLPYEDERLLAEISRRPGVYLEFLEILKYRNSPDSKPRQTWFSLLQNWQSELDKARGYDPKRAGNGITTYQQKQALLEEISRHPANRTFTGSVPNPTPLQTEDLKEKRERLKALNTLIAKGGVNG